MDEKKYKRIPLIPYLCCLLAVSMLFAGATFSRYTGAQSGNTDVSLGSFIYSYEIGDLSAATFSNVNYWLDIDGGRTAMNPARSVRFTVRNYTLLEDGSAERISDVDLQSTLRLYAPAEFAGNLAVQLVQVDENGGYITKTPQYVLRDLIYDSAGNFARQNGETQVIHTADSEDFDARGDQQGNPFDERLTVTGSFSGTAENHTGTIYAACDETGNSLTLTATVQQAEYSVGFYRRLVADENRSAPQVFLECSEEIPFYTLDIGLPELCLEADGAPQERTFVLFLTVTEITRNDDFSATWDGSSLGQALLLLESGKPAYFNGARITGYHFNVNAPVYELKGGIMTLTGEQTTLRIRKDYSTDDSGNPVLSFHHVAPLSEGAASVVHPIEQFYDETGEAILLADFENITQVHPYYGLCSNQGASGYIAFADLPDSPYYSTHAVQVTGTPDYAMEQALSKGYATRLNVLFVQASVSRREGGAG